MWKWAVSSMAIVLFVAQDSLARSYYVPRSSEEKIFFASMLKVALLSLGSLLVYHYILHRREKLLDVWLIGLIPFSLFFGSQRYLEWLNWQDVSKFSEMLLLSDYTIFLWLAFSIAIHAWLFKWIKLPKPWHVILIIHLLMPTTFAAVSVAVAFLVSK